MKKVLLYFFLISSGLFISKKGEGYMTLPQFQKMQITSPAFQDNDFLPLLYTCDGNNISPPLEFHNAPSQARSLVLIHDDPDAPGGTWDHWILFNLPARTSSLQQGIKTLPSGTKQGLNSWEKKEYGGACPPDREHQYVFKLYALDVFLDLQDGASKEEIEQAMQGHILDQATLTARYKRPFQ